MNELYRQTNERFQKYIMPTYAPAILFVEGRGSELFDADRRRYLDCATGISVVNLGHCHPGVTRAIQEQAARLVHVSNLFLNPVTPKLAERMISLGFDGAVFFCNSGAEANEGMFKFARKWGSTRGKSHIISMVDSFHGRTLATLAATGRAKYRQGFAPDMPGFDQVPFNDFAALAAAVRPDTCAIVLEPVQGEGGILPAGADYLARVRQLCDEKEILLLFDEVQCGMGRTGSLYAWQHFGIAPDAFSLAKAIANGLPMGAFVAQRRWAGTLAAGQHASTFGGGPVVAAAALAVFDAMEKEDVLGNCRRMGEKLRAGLRELGKEYSWVRDVRGVGLMIGVELDRPAGALQQKAMEAGLVTLTAGETVWRWLPALNIGEAEVDEALALADKAMREYDRIIQSS